MLKQGIMLIGDAKYSLYELKTKDFYRFDITENGAEFSSPNTSSVLFSCYKRKRRRWYGDMELYGKYIDAVKGLLARAGCGDAEVSPTTSQHSFRRLEIIQRLFGRNDLGRVADVRHDLLHGLVGRPAPAASNCWLNHSYRIMPPTSQSGFGGCCYGIHLIVPS